jgi:hypothetical protein
VVDRVNTRAVLVDCGTAKRSGEQLIGAGTPGYAAPESFAGEAETTATDVYGLGATAYTIITGRLVYGSGDALSILARQLDGPPDPPSQHRAGLSTAVDEVLLKALAVNPAARFASPGAFATALGAAIRRCETTSGRMTAPLAAAMEISASPALHARSGSILFSGESADSLGAIRGAMFRTAGKELAQRLGEWSVRKIAENDQELGALLRPTLAPMSWHPSRSLITLLERPEIATDACELARAIGIGVVNSTFAQVFGADPAELTPEAALAAAPSYWNRYFTTGDVDVLAAVADHADLRISGPTREPIYRNLVCGLLERVAELTGVGGVAVTFSPVGADAWQFSVCWRLEDFSFDDSIEPSSMAARRLGTRRPTGSPLPRTPPS